MYAKEFQEKAWKLIREFDELLKVMPQKGDKPEDCQKLTIQKALNELNSTINGVEDSDLTRLVEGESIHASNLGRGHSIIVTEGQYKGDIVTCVSPYGTRAYHPTYLNLTNTDVVWVRGTSLIGKRTIVDTTEFQTLIDKLREESKVR